VVPAIPLITKIRIVALIIAAFLLVGGLKATIHPKLRFVDAPQSEPGPGRTYPVELVTSQTSRAFGIVRMILGIGLAIYVLAPWLGLQTRRSHFAKAK
jgi:hypothetical protein